MGQIYGTKAALPYMRRQRSGTIINVSSEVGVRSVPLQTIYCAAKHGIKGFTEALRLEHERSGINVSLILPGSTNTPLFSHARSKVGVELALPKPVYQPEAVAEAIVHAVQNPRRDIFIGIGSKTFDVLERLSPWLADQILLSGGYGFESQKTNQPDNGRDNFFEPWNDRGSIRGDFQGQYASWYTRIFEYHPSMKLSAAGAALGTLAYLARMTRRNGRELASENHNVPALEATRSSLSSPPTR
jgi:hypothetical protein